MPNQPADRLCMIDPGADLESLGERARRLAGEVFAPIAEKGEFGRVNRPLVRAIGEHGLLAELFPQEQIGEPERRTSALRLAVLKEYLARGCTAAEDALGLQGLGFYPIWRWGTADQVARWHPGVVDGTTVAAYALTEPEAGSDTASMRLTATRDGDAYLLNGTKIYISNAPEADVYTVYARTADTGRRGVTAFIVPGDADGLGGEPIDLIMSHPVGRLEFDDVRVPAANVLGEVDGGYEIAMSTLELFRISVGGFAVGCAEAAIEAAVAHAGTRRQFGGPLAGLQAVGHKLADMTAATAAARLLIYHAARCYDEARQPIRPLSAMAKLQATETAQWVVDAALQIHGAAGLVHDHVLGHLYKEVRAPRIYEGTTEVLRTIIAGDLYR